MPGKLDLLGDTVRRLISYGDSQPHYEEILRAVDAGSMPPSRQVLLPMPEQGWRVTDQLGGDATGRYLQAVVPRPAEPPFYAPYSGAGRNKVASIVGMHSVPSSLRYAEGSDALRQRGFLSGLLDTLQDDGADRLLINLQSQDTQAAMRRLMERGRVQPIGLGPWDSSRYPSLFNLR